MTFYSDKPDKSVVPRKGCDDSDIISWSKFGTVCDILTCFKHLCDVPVSTRVNIKGSTCISMFHVNFSAHKCILLD